jgi:integrase
MSIRNRTWKTAKGDAKEAWVVDYVDQHGKRRLKTFRLQREAKVFSATTATVEIRQGVYTPDSASVTVADAGWRCSSARAICVRRASVGWREEVGSRPSFF